MGRHGKVTLERVPAAQQGNERAAAAHAKAASLRPYMTAGIALVGASVIAVSPVTPSLPDLPVEQPAVQLLADSSILNVPVNLLIAAANIPYYESLALKEYAYALGPAGTRGGVPGWVPLSASAGNGAVEGPDGLLYADGGTGSWWKESHDGNTWGWDNGNWPQMAAMSHAILPFAFTLPIVQQLEVLAEAEYIAGARVNCEFECADVLGYLGGWLMFQTPLTDLLSGNYNYPDTVNAVGADGKPVSQPFWAGDPGNRLNPLVPFQAVADNLMQDPSQNPVHFPDLGGVLSDGWMLGQDYNNNYNPFVTGSFLYWGAPTLYSAPALLAGLVQNFTGIPNQFVGIGGWYGAGGDPTGGTAGPADLITGVPAGFAYLAQGLLGYLNPGTYIGSNGISLSNTLLRTYAWGSLPGSDILRRLIGLDPNPAPVSTLANSQSGTGTNGSTASVIGSPLGSLLGSFSGLGGFAGSSTQQTAAPTAPINKVETANENNQDQVVTLNGSAQPVPQPIDPGARATEALNSVKVPPQGSAQEGINKTLDNVAAAGPKLNVQKLNPLDRGNASDGDTTGNHGLGAGKTPVRDLITKVTGGLDNQKDATASTGATSNTGTAG